MKQYIHKHQSALIILSIILFTWFLSKYVIQFTLIQGDSMLPSYHHLQLVVVNKLAKDYTYDDVIVFSCDTLSATLVKRIVAVPGDTVCIQSGTLYVNQMPSRVVPAGTELSYSGIAAAPIRLGTDEYFVLGDNYEVSKDSRYTQIGPVKYGDIIGKVF